MFCPEVDTRQQHPKLFRIDLTPRLLDGARPGKSSFLQPLLPQAEPGSVPYLKALRNQVPYFIALLSQLRLG
jgi:hypothetical protein